MWCYLNVARVRKNFTNERTHVIEETEVSIFWPTKIETAELYGRYIYINAQKYDFDRFDLNGSPIFVRNE